MFEDMHKHRFIFMPSVRQPYQIHNWIKGWLWHHTLNLSTNNHSTTHITYPGWQNPNSSQIPIPAASSVGKGSSSPRGATQVQKLQDTKGRTVKGSHQSAALALATVCWNAAPLSPKVKTTQTHMHIPQKSFSIGTHLCLWQGGRSLRLALSMGKLRAFWSSQRYNCSYREPDGGQSDPYRNTGLSQNSYSTRAWENALVKTKWKTQASCAFLLV